MGDIREINHTYRIDPRTQQTIAISKKPSREQPQKDDREPQHDEIIITHHEEQEVDEDEVPPPKNTQNPEELPGLDISA